jgi:hypothetical protein
MPWQKGVVTRDRSYDHYIANVIQDNAWTQENLYFGIENEETATIIRQKLRTAGNHMNPPVAVKAFWKECPGCPQGGPLCRYHVSFTVYDKDVAREYKKRMDKAVGRTMDT